MTFTFPSYPESSESYAQLEQGRSPNLYLLWTESERGWADMRYIHSWMAMGLSLLFHLKKKKKKKVKNELDSV